MEQDTSLRAKLHYYLFAILLALSAIRFLIWTTPNNKLHENGFGNAVGLDFIFGFGLAILIAIISFRNRKSNPSKPIYYFTQLLAWGQSIGLLVVFVCSVLYAGFSGMV